MATSFFGSFHTCFGAFVDQTALKFGKRSHDMKDQPATLRIRVDAISETLESSSLPAQLVNQFA
jgi:hypothetical protein